MKQKYGVLGIAICMLGLMGCSDRSPISTVAAYEDNVTMGIEDTYLDIDVLANDIYFVGVGKELRLEIGTFAEHGAVVAKTVNEKQLIRYVPTEEGFEGRDSFRYCAQIFSIDTGERSVAGCARVNVIVGNGEPLVNAGPDSGTLIGTPLRIEGSASDDRDASDALTYEWKEGTEVLGDSAVLMYDPALMGQHKLVLTATDTEGASGSDEVNITVNGFNVIDAHDDEASMPATDNQVNIAVLDNDEMAGEVSTVTLEVETSPGNGVAVSRIWGDKKVIIYIPGDGFVGTDTFTYRATIGGVADIATVTVHVISNENHAPTVGDDEMTVNCETGGSKTLEGSDIDEDTLTFSIDRTNISYGNVDFNSTTGVIRISIDGSEDSEACMLETASSFAYKANDGDLDSSPGTITIIPQ